MDGVVETSGDLRFLRNLPQPAPRRMAELDAAFHFTDTGNDEILDTWLAIRKARRALVELKSAAYAFIEKDAGFPDEGENAGTLRHYP